MSVEHSQWLDTEDLRRCLPILSGAPTPNLSPEALESWNRPVPQDDESDASSLAPLPSGQLDSERDPMHAFQTFGDTKNEITSGGEMPHDMDPNGTEVNENLEPLATGMGGKRAERMGNRRGQVDGKTSAGATSVQGEGEKRENYGHENGLEEALGDQVLQHFQQEAMRLQSQNSMLSKELQKLREEKQRNELNVPPSWVDHARQPTPPPRKTPPSHDSQQEWISPESFRCTPNGTRAPSRPPPPSPPPLPA